MIDFFFSHALPKVTTTCAMSDLPTVYETDYEVQLCPADLEELVENIGTMSHDRPYTVELFCRLLNLQPELSGMRDARGKNLMRKLTEYPATFMNAVDIFFKGPSSILDMFYEKDNFGISHPMLKPEKVSRRAIRDMFYEKDNRGISPIMFMVEKLSRRAVRGGRKNLRSKQEAKKTIDAIILEVRISGKRDVADVLLEIWWGNSARHSARLM